MTLVRTARMSEIQTSDNQTSIRSAFGIFQISDVRILAFHCMYIFDLGYLEYSLKLQAEEWTSCPTGYVHHQLLDVRNPKDLSADVQVDL